MLHSYTVVQCDCCGYHWHPRHEDQAEAMIQHACRECGGELHFTDNPEDRETCETCARARHEMIEQAKAAAEEAEERADEARAADAAQSWDAPQDEE